MNQRAQELAQRREALIARSSAQRRMLVESTEHIIVRLGRVDQRIDAVRRFFSRPWLLAGAVFGVGVLFGPSKLVRIGSRAAMWFGTAKRVQRIVQQQR